MDKAFAVYVAYRFGHLAEDLPLHLLFFFEWMLFQELLKSASFTVLNLNIENIYSFILELFLEVIGRAVHLIVLVGALLLCGRQPQSSLLLLCVAHARDDIFVLLRVVAA